MVVDNPSKIWCQYNVMFTTDFCKNEWYLTVICRVTFITLLDTDYHWFPLYILCIFGSIVYNRSLVFPHGCCPGDYHWPMKSNRALLLFITALLSLWRQRVTGKTWGAFNKAIAHQTLAFSMFSPSEHGVRLNARERLRCIALVFQYATYLIG